MKNRKRMCIWMSLLLAGALSVSGSDAVWAQEEQAFGQEILSENAVSGPDLSQEEEEESRDVSDDKEEPETVSADAAPGQKEEETVMISENGGKGQDGLSDNALFKDTGDLKPKAEVDDQAVAKEKKPLDVVLPEDISFEMVAVGKEKLEGMIRSKQFCIENKGTEDVRIQIQGKCLGKGEGEYAVTASSTANGYVPGKKNVWIYLKWEDEDRDPLEQPGITMGDGTAPGQGEIILKARSKAYFSFEGDMRSDTGEVWESDELKLSLSVSMEIYENIDGKN